MPGSHLFAGVIDKPQTVVSFVFVFEIGKIDTKDQRKALQRQPGDLLIVSQGRKFGPKIPTLVLGYSQRSNVCD